MSDEYLLQITTPVPSVRVLTLNLPHLRNAMTEELTTAWSSEVARLRQDSDVRAMVVTGAGSAFCSGADLSWLDQGSQSDITPTRLRDKMLPFYQAWLSVRDLPFPTIAAVNGPTVGAGLCLALACDLRYAAPQALFSAPFIYLGTHGGMAVTHMLPEAIGVARAREMLYTGREVSAEEALSWGLVAGVADEVLDHAIAVASRIASAAPIATKLTKVGLRQATFGFEASLQWEGLAQPQTLATSDLHEGILAKREHRGPRFTGD